MTSTYDVLVLESHPGAATEAGTALEDAGHHVHRCTTPGSPGFPCVALTNPGSCPVDQSVDVALLVRRSIMPRPTALERGVSCAVRAGIPVVEQGPDLLDPFDSWIASRVASDDDVVAACEAAVHAADDPLREEILCRIGRLLAGAGFRAIETTCRFEQREAGLVVHLGIGAPIDRRLRQALAVRVLDAVRSIRRTVGHVDIQVHPSGD